MPTLSLCTRAAGVAGEDPGKRQDHISPWVRALPNRTLPSPRLTMGSMWSGSAGYHPTHGFEPTHPTAPRHPEAPHRVVVFNWTGNRGGQGAAHNLVRMKWGEAMESSEVECCIIVHCITVHCKLYIAGRGV